MTMLVDIPKRHNKYLKMLVKAKCVANEEEAKRLAFEDGLNEAKSDICMGSPQPDMDLSLLRGKKIALELPNKSEYMHQLELISQGFKVTQAKAASIAFLQGLFDQYLLLRDSQLYQQDRRFRKIINEMPHDTCYDAMVSDSEEEHDW
ncbi:MAG: hypothetical protein WCD72_02620 [Dehalococcoidia bacterium]